LWRIADGQRISILKGHSAAIVGLAFSSNEQILVTMDVKGHVRTWDIRTASLTGKELTAWLCDRLKGDLAILYGLDLENMLLRDLVHAETGYGLNLVEEIFDRWPELKELPILKPL
jgi:WD40 repeat protein